MSSVRQRQTKCICFTKFGIKSNRRVEYCSSSTMVPQALRQGGEDTVMDASMEMSENPVLHKLCMEKNNLLRKKYVLGGSYIFYTLL